MTQSDSDLLKSLEIARIELSARLRDHCNDPQLWADTVNSSVLALAAAKDRMQALLSKEADSNRKLSEAEYKKRDVDSWQRVKDGVESRLERLVNEAANERIANAKRAAELFESVEVEHERLQQYQHKLDERAESLDQREQRLFLIASKVEEDATRAASHRRHAEDYHQQLLGLQKQLDEQREQLGRRIAEAKDELNKQQKLTSEIDQNAQGYRDRLREAEDSKRKADALMIEQANVLAALNRRIQDYENRLHLVNKREKFVMQRWDETCRQVAHLKLSVDLQGMPTP